MPERKNIDQDNRPREDDAALHQKALSSFFASEEELASVRSMSLDLYRDEMDARLRSENMREYLSFVLAEEIFGIDIVNIKEIIKPPLITQVPRTDPVILGILSLRGVIVPVLDLRRRLGQGTYQPSRKSRILIVEREEGMVGLMVDSVRGVIRMRDDQIEPPPAVFDRVEAEHIRGVSRSEGEMVTLLNVDSISDVKRFVQSSRRERAR